MVLGGPFFNKIIFGVQLSSLGKHGNFHFWILIKDVQLTHSASLQSDDQAKTNFENKRKKAKLSTALSNHHVSASKQIIPSYKKALKI